MAQTSPATGVASSRIPIRNLYYMLCYAWNQFRAAESISVDIERSPDLPSLFAKVLAAGIRQLHRRGPERGYVLQHALLAGLRGRILLAESIKDGSYLRQRLYCEFDELELDILPNRILKTTTSALLSVSDLDSIVKAELRDCARILAPVSVIRLDAQVFRRVQYHRNNQLYGLLISICEMLFRLQMPTCERGPERFQDIERDETIMASVFEEFVRNFYYFEQDEFEVRRQRIEWAASASSSTDRRYLPAMNTDVTLESSTKIIIVECKYYRRTLQTFHESDSIRSEHLYQLHAYLTNLRIQSPPVVQLQGILLYPRVDEALDLRFHLHNTPVRVYTLDLTKHWQEIEQDLLSLLSFPMIPSDLIEPMNCVRLTR